MACVVVAVVATAALCSGAMALKVSTSGSIEDLGAKFQGDTLPLEPFEQPLESFPVSATNPDTPRMLGMRGCSGSTAIDEIARKLFRMHGLNVAPAADPVFKDDKPSPPEGEGWPSELLRPEVNWLYEEAGGDISKAMEMQVETVGRKNQTLFFKGLIHELANEDTWNTYVPFFNKYGLYTVLAARNNQLDEIVCQVRDCFSSNYGYPVDEAGHESNLCFERRNSKLDKVAETFIEEVDVPLLETKNLSLENETLTLEARDGYKAFINVQHLVWAINHEYELHEKASARLREAGFDFEDVTAEDLLEFQTVKTNISTEVERSVTTWGRVLKSFGVNPDYARIRTFLQQYVGSYPEAKPHREVIWNIDEVEETLLNSKFDYAKFLRK